MATLDQTRNFCRGDAVWSEDTPLGALNTRLRGAWYYDAPGAARRASHDAAFSDYQAERRHVPICEWTEQTLAPTPTITLESPRLEGAHQTLHALTARWQEDRPEERLWAGCWDASPWQIQRGAIVARHEVRICEQRADGATPSWSDQAGLSDYVDGLACRIETYDPDIGLTYPDPYTGQMIRIPPRHLPQPRYALTICGQRSDGVTPTWSGAEGLSHYLDGIRCEVIETVPAPSVGCEALSAGEPPDWSAPVLAMGPGRASLRVCRQLDVGATPDWSGAGALSHYVDRLHCEWATFDYIVWSGQADGYQRLIRCRQMADAEDLVASGGARISDYLGGLACERIDYDPASGRITRAPLSHPPRPEITHLALAPTSTVTWPTPGFEQSVQTLALWPAVPWQSPVPSVTWAEGEWDARVWRIQDAIWTLKTDTRICEQWPDGATPVWSVDGASSDYVDGLDCRPGPVS